VPLCEFDDYYASWWFMALRRVDIRCMGFIWLLIIWHSLIRLMGYDPNKSSWIGCRISQLITFISVVIAWVFFRAESFKGAINVLHGMAGVNGIALPESTASQLNSIAGLGDYLKRIGWEFTTKDILLFNTTKDVVFLGLLLGVACLFPTLKNL